MDIAFIAAREADTGRWVVCNVAEAAAGIRQCPGWWAWPRARGLSVTDRAHREVHREVGGRARGCPFTVNWKDWVFV